jgi:hypothetical protein
MGSFMALTRGLNSAAAVRSSAAVEIGGRVFDDGKILDLVAVPGSRSGLRFIVYNGKTTVLRDSFERDGQLYVPMRLPQGLSAAIRFPYARSDYGTTTELVSRLAGRIQQYVCLTERDLQLTVSWILSTWVADALPLAPGLVLSGAFPTEAGVLLRFLSSVCRRGLCLGEVTPAGLCGLPGELTPTLLIHQSRLSKTMRAMLTASSQRGYYLAKSADVVDLHGSKALYFADTDGGLDCAQSMIRISVLPGAPGLKLLNRDAENLMASELQPLLLDYRLRNLAKVRKAGLDVPTFSMSTRLLASALAASIADDKALAAEVISFLQPQDEDARAEVLPEATIISVVLAFVHEGKESMLQVQNLASYVNTALRAQGENLEFLPAHIGNLLKSLGLFSTRLSGGKFLRLDGRLSREIHNLARKYGVRSELRPECPDCEVEPTPEPAKAQHASG